MSFLPKLLRAFAFIPAIVQGIEAVFGAKTGSQKKESALSFLAAALQLAEAIASKEVIDEQKFRDGMSKIIDGVVMCLNASAWAKAK